MRPQIPLRDKSQKWKRVAPPRDLCEVCGGELDIDQESGESHCPVCESPEE